MAHSAEKKQQIRKLYVQGHPLKQAAILSGVNYQTARNWKRRAANDGDDWDLVKSAKNLTRDETQNIGRSIIEDFVVLFHSTMNEVKKAEDLSAMHKADIISKLSDSYAKTINAAGKANPALNKLAVAMDVLQDLAEFIKNNNPNLLHGFLELLEPFGQEVAIKYGK